MSRRTAEWTHYNQATQAVKVRVWFSDHLENGHFGIAIERGKQFVH